jgi:DNA polymerase I
MENKTFYLIDGSSYFYRAFYALGRLSNARGMATQAIYGFAQMLLKVLKEKRPDYVGMIFDAPGPTFRHTMYPEYKGTRQKMPEDLAVQIPYIKELVQYHGIRQLEVDGYEADDIIATLVLRSKQQGLQMVIASADKDLHQLIEDPQVQQWDPQKDRVITSKEVAERFGIEPRRMIDLLALMGDSSDHVPGVPGVGEKTAQKLLQQWGSLDELFAHVGDLTSAPLRSKLASGRSLAYLSRDLVTLKSTVPLEIHLEEFVPGAPQIQELLRLYQDLGFKTLLAAVREQGGLGAAQAGSATQSAARVDRVITTPEALTELVAQLHEQTTFSIDLETTSTDPMQAQLVGIALSWQDHEACYVPVGHSGRHTGVQLPRQAVLQALEPLLTAPEPGKVGQNIKYEWVVFKRHGVELRGLVFDTMVASYLLDPGKRSHRLEVIAAEHLGEDMISYTDVTGKGKEQISFAAVEVSTAANYACEDAEITWRVAPILRRKLEAAHLQDLYDTLELPLIEVLARMEYRGIAVDPRQLETLALDLEKSLEQKSAEIFRMAGQEFNIQSPKQLAFILFEKLGLPVIKRTKSGPSTDVSVLEELAAEHPMVEQLLAYRSLAKLKGTYAESLPRLIHPETGRIHTSYNQTVAATGRLSSSDPNLQNIPIRSEEGQKIRAAFVASPGHVLLASDYSQIELRLLAHFSQDEHLVAAFHADEDIHRRTAAEMLGIPPHEVTPEMRRQAKTINFGIIYGMGPFGLARQLRISNSNAKAAIDRYFDHYRGVRRFIEQVIKEARQQGFSQTLAGRKRMIPELASRNRTVRQQGERLAVNATLQGTAADLIKKAMIDIERSLTQSGLRCAMLLQVHDELIFEVPLEELEEAKTLVREKMEQVWGLSVPLKVDLGWGKNWMAAHP